MTPDFVAIQPGGRRFFPTPQEAVAYAQKHGCGAYRVDYEQVDGGFMPHVQQVRTVLWEPDMEAAA